MGNAESSLAKKKADLQEQKNEEKESLDEEKVLWSAKQAFYEGNRLFRESRFDLAKTEYLNALQILRDYEMHEDLHTAAALSNIGILDFAEGRFSEAKTLLEESLAIRKGWSPMNKPVSFDESMETISLSLLKDNFFCRVPEDQKLLAKELKNHGQTDAAIADAMNNLAACLEVLGNLDEAKPLYEESLNLRKIVYGESSVKVAESMQNLSTILDSKGRLREAEILLQKALLIHKDKLGEDCPETAVTMNNLGVLCTHLGRFNEAKAFFEHAVRIRILFYGDDHPCTLCARRNLDYLLNRMHEDEGDEIAEKLGGNISVDDTSSRRPKEGLTEGTKDAEYIRDGKVEGAQ